MKSPPTGDAPSVPMTVIKTVFDLEIPLHNSGPAGLGVTVYTKTTSAKGVGEIGVYIKSIVAGGAAALVSTRPVPHPFLCARHKALNHHTPF